MLITSSHRAAICNLVADVQLTGVAGLAAVSHRFNFNFNISSCVTRQPIMGPGLLLNILPEYSICYIPLVSDFTN